MRRSLLSPVVAAGLALVLAGCGGGGAADAGCDTSDVSGSLHGAVPDAATPLPDLTLTDTGGAPYDVVRRTADDVTLLYFGYTHCPDECPTSMADVATALRKVPADVASKVSVVFVTTDPWRDRRPVLRQWLDGFSRSFVGLTGTPQQIAAAEVRMNMPISKREPAKPSDGSGRYAVAHFAAVMAYGRDGRLATLYPSGVPPSDIAADLRVLVKGC